MSFRPHQSAASQFRPPVHSEICGMVCVCVCCRGVYAVESREQKVQWSERLREEAQANVREGGWRGHKAPVLTPTA